MLAIHQRQYACRAHDRHAGLDPASRDLNLLPPSWIPAYAGMTTVRYSNAETVKP